MTKQERQEVAGQVKSYLAETLQQMRQDLLKMLASEEGARQAHYLYQELATLEAKLQIDINAGIREVKKSG